MENQELINKMQRGDHLKVNITPFIHRVIETIEAHSVKEQWGYTRDLVSNQTPDLYGTADAAIILYTLGELPKEKSACKQWVESLQSFQSSNDGLFHGIGHHPIHGTAFAISALQLFDAKPKYLLTALESLKDRNKLEAFLCGLDWQNQPWGDSQQGSGIFASMVLSGMVDEEWENWYFDWLWEHTDPATGLWKKGAIVDLNGHPIGAPLFHHVAGSFHYLFNLDYRKKKVRYPEQLINTCLDMFNSQQFPLSEQEFSFNELDWLYTFISAKEQTEHRAEEATAMISQVSEQFIQFVLRKSTEEGPYGDLHSLCGAVCALALVQSVLSERVISDRLLNKVLDRRPFI
ncbi:hypothetical protein [Paenibacillus pabuli]|uniref:hypothetical protein n=1 Tax=Paenibacillus pabuli TaxID=1472 RepID=UPI003CE77B3C